MNPQPPPPGENQDPPIAPSGLPDPAAAGASGAPGSAAAPGDARSTEAGRPRPGMPPPAPPGGQAGPATLPPPHAGAVPQHGVPPQNFFDWVRGQGIYRDRQRWVGGVAGGIARRLGVDPLIVRGVLIVLAVFAGVGVLLYGVAWALLPEPDGRIHLQEAGAGRWSTGMTGSLVATAIGFPGVGSGMWGWDGHGFGAFLWTVFWLGGVGYLIYYLARRNKARSGTAPMPAYVQPGGMAAPAAQAGPGSTQAAAFAGTSQDQPGGPWTAVPVPPGSYAGGYSPADGYSAADGGYSPADGGHSPADGYSPTDGGYSPVPGQAPVPARPRNPGPGTPAAAVTAGLALLVGGGVKALDAANVIDPGNAGNAVVWAAGAAVLGLGILIAGLRGRTSGILGFFAVIALLMGALFNVLPNADRFRGQNVDWTPSSIEQARNGFEIMGGTGTLDLTRLAVNPPLATDVVVPIDAMASNLRVVIPDTVPVRLEADMMMGNLNGAGGNHGGMMSQQIDYNATQPGARLVLQVSGAMSNVTIQEGN